MCFASGNCVVVARKAANGVGILEAVECINTLVEAILYLGHLIFRALYSVMEND